MMDYERGVQEGVSVRPPPIALPPRKIESKKNKDSHAMQEG